MGQRVKASTCWGAASMAVVLYFVTCGQCRSENSDHERVLVLEKKVAELEALLKNAVAGSRSRISAKVRARKPEVANGATKDARETSKVAKDASPGASLATTRDQPAPSNSPPPAQEGGARAAADQVGVGRPDDAPQELFVLRENNVTLKPASWEVFTQASYLSTIGALQDSRALLGATQIRYGALDWLELSANIPYGSAIRTTLIGPGKEASYKVTSFGDSTIQANARLLQQSRDWPGVVLSLGAITPTGPNPYFFANYALDRPGAIATPNPIDVLRDYFSIGAWGIHSNLQFYKTVDPIILFCGGGVDYLFGENVDGYYVRQGERYNYNAGFSFALSEKTTLGFSVNGTYQGNLSVNGKPVLNSSIEPILARLSVIQRVNKNLFLEPSVAFGLNSYAPNTEFDLGVRARF